MVGSLKKDNAAPGLEMLKRTKIKRTKIAQLSRLNCGGFNHNIKINTCCNNTPYVELHQLVSYLKTHTKTTEFSLITSGLHHTFLAQEESQENRKKF